MGIFGIPVLLLGSTQVADLQLNTQEITLLG